VKNATGGFVKVEQIREQQRLTQREFAFMLGVTERAVQFWESGRTHPSRRHREAIAKRFGVEVTFDTNDSIGA
jgi:DNA-binding transcriptional regulator YiaG